MIILRLEWIIAPDSGFRAVLSVSADLAIRPEPRRGSSSWLKLLDFIGLGVMGKPMAKHLIKAGHRLVVHNRSRGAVDELVAAGATAAASPAEVARAVVDRHHDAARHA